MRYQFTKPRRPVTRVFIHCSASDNPAHDNVATMDRWHKERGWAGVGYHFFIRKSGLLELGRDLEKTPAAQRGHNRATIAICLHGLEKDQFTAEQFSTLIGLCHQINEAYDGQVTFHGHCEVAAKTCPVIDYAGILNLRRNGALPRSRELARIADLELPTAPRGRVFSDGLGGNVRMGMKSGHVSMLQRKLTGLGYFTGAIDGDFGPRTRAAVLAFQADNDLVTDGIVGPVTAEVLRNAGPRSITKKRSSATLADLDRKGSRIARASMRGGAAGLVITGGGALQLLEDMSGTVSRITGSFGSISDTLAQAGPWIGGLAIIAGGYVVWQSFRAGRARLEDHRTGKTA